MVDLTPAAIGPFCVPSVNLAEHPASCVPSVAYGAIVATVGSKSVGPGTRENIDEFTRTTSAAVAEIGAGRCNAPL